MLTQFQFGIITPDEARLLVHFIEKMTAAEGLTVNYKKMQELGVMSIHTDLKRLIDEYDHYQMTLKNLEQ
jgi:hypothetical protein